MKELKVFLTATVIAFLIATPTIWAVSVFPTSLDSLPTVSSGDTITSAAWNNIVGAINNIETKVGINSSTATSSIDYNIYNSSGYLNTNYLATGTAATTYLTIAASSTFARYSDATTTQWDTAYAWVNGTSSTMDMLYASSTSYDTVYEWYSASSSNYDSAYSHSILTSGNPHSVAYSDLGVNTYATGGTGTSTALATGYLWIGLDGTGNLMQIASSTLTGASYTAGDHLTLTGTDFDLDSEIYTKTLTFIVGTSTKEVVAKNKNALTLTKAYCYTDTGTSTMNLIERTLSSLETQTTILSSALTCLSKNQAIASTTSFGDSAMAADALIVATTSSATGTVGGGVYFFVDYSLND